MEAGETDQEAVARELLEETGLIVLPAGLTGTVVRGPYEIHDYRCTVTGGTLRAGDDASDARWVSLQEYDELDRAGLLVDTLTSTLRSWSALPLR